MPTVCHRNYGPHVPYNSTGRTISITGAWCTQVLPNPLNGIEVEVHTTQDRPLTPQRSQYSSGRDMDGQLYDKSHELV